MTDQSQCSSIPKDDGFILHGGPTVGFGCLCLSLVLLFILSFAFGVGASSFMGILGTAAIFGIGIFSIVYGSVEMIKAK